MADSLNMNGLSLNDSQHAPHQNGYQEKAAYIPPHMRGRPAPPSNGPNGFDGYDSGPPPMGNGINGGAWPASGYVEADGSAHLTCDNHTNVVQ